MDDEFLSFFAEERDGIVRIGAESLTADAFDAMFG